MKNILFVAMALVVALSSCRKDKTPVGNEVEVSFDVQTSNLKSHSLTANDLIAICVKENGTNKVIAGGLFNGYFTFGSLSATLNDTKTYTVTATCVVNGESVDFHEADGNKYYGAPFNVDPAKEHLHKDADNYITMNGGTLAADDFKTQPYNFVDLAGQSTDPDNPSLSETFVKADRWYFQNTNVTVSEGDPIIEINMRRVSTKVRFILTSAAEKTIKARLVNDDAVLESPTLPLETVTQNQEIIYTLPNIGFSYNDIANSFTHLNYQYTITKGVITTPASGWHPITLRANTITEVQIDASTNQSNTFTITLDDDWIDL